MSEQEVISNGQALLDQQEYPRLRQFIWSRREACASDETKQIVVRLWEESLYREFQRNRPAGSADSPLSSSMRYKLRKKHPCPVELDVELRVKNARLPKHVHDGLNAWLKLHHDNPYPNKEEKDRLASTLGITAQQVNRWFIQRRKMLRQRGGALYLGRGTGSESTASASATNPSSLANSDEDDEDDEDDEELGHTRFTNHLMADLGENHHDMLTPPASVAGEDDEMNALDLTWQLQQQQQQQELKSEQPQQYPVILEQVQPYWKPSGSSKELFFFKGEKSKNSASEFDEAEIEAANALVFMGNKNGDL